MKKRNIILEKFELKKYLPYLLVAFIFIMSIYLVLLIVDNFVMNSMVHDRETVKVPNVTNKIIDKAQKELKSRGLSPKIKFEQYSESYPKGIVISQNPNSNSEVKANRPVYLVVSKGKEKVPVPSLIGKTIKEVNYELMKRNLTLGEVFFQVNEYYGKDTVFAQSKSGGSMVPYGDAVSVTVSSGSNLLIPVPVLIGQRLDEVEVILIENGFKLGTVSYQVNGTFQANTVIEQFPTELELAIKGSYINIILSK